MIIVLLLLSVLTARQTRPLPPLSKDEAVGCIVTGREMPRMEVGGVAASGGGGGGGGVVSGAGSGGRVVVMRRSMAEEGNSSGLPP